MSLEFLHLAMGMRRWAYALALWVLIMQFAGCRFGVPLNKEPVVVTQQQRSATILPGESTRDSVRAALGEPWLQSRYWGVDVYRARDTYKELGGTFFTILPVPLGVFTSDVDGYVLVAYDALGRVVQVSSGKRSGLRFPELYFVEPLMLRARDLNLGVESVGQRGVHLMADPHRLSGYLELSRQSASCTVVLAFDEKNSYQHYPDRVVIDNAEPIDLQPFFGSCETGKSCPPQIRQGGQYVTVRLVHPVTLPPGSHRLVMTDSSFKGRYEANFQCAPGEVRYGIIRGHSNCDLWWQTCTLEAAAVIFEDRMPAQWESYSMLLYRGARWFAQPEPDRHD